MDNFKVQESFGKYNSLENNLNEKTKYNNVVKENSNTLKMSGTHIGKLSESILKNHLKESDSKTGINPDIFKKKFKKTGKNYFYFDMRSIDKNISLNKSSIFWNNLVTIEIETKTDILDNLDSIHIEVWSFKTLFDANLREYLCLLKLLGIQVEISKKKIKLQLLGMLNYNNLNLYPGERFYHDIMIKSDKDIENIFINIENNVPILLNTQKAICSVNPSNIKFIIKSDISLIASNVYEKIYLNPQSKYIIDLLIKNCIIIEIDIFGKKYKVFLRGIDATSLEEIQNYLENNNYLICLINFEFFTR